MQAVERTPIKKLLIVDDEQSLRSLLEKYFSVKGYQVDLASDVKEAESKLKWTEYDVVISDIQMPGRPGTDLLPYINRNYPDLPVILLTGMPSVETASVAVRSRAFDYVPKPVKLADLDRIVGNACNLRAFKREKERLEIENLQYQKNLEKLVEDRTEELTQALFGIVKAMSVTVEKRDPYTAGHQVRVAKLSRAIAEQMMLSIEKVEGVYLAGIIHDIGKISVPAEILAKPSSLLEEEFCLIKRHPQTGYDILKTIRFPWPIASIVLQHHERLDGTGYPGGLSGEDILVEARIVAVADTVESMASHRPYRPELGIKTALEEIEKNRGIIYDSRVVDACLKLFREQDYCLLDE